MDEHQRLTCVNTGLFVSAMTHNNVSIGRCQLACALFGLPIDTGMDLLRRMDYDDDLTSQSARLWVCRTYNEVLCDWCFWQDRLKPYMRHRTVLCDSAGEQTCNRRFRCSETLITTCHPVVGSKLYELHESLAVGMSDPISIEELKAVLREYGYAADDSCAGCILSLP